MNEQQPHNALFAYFNIAKKQKIAILAPIHQPSKAVFQAFDDPLLLHRSGRHIYGGAIEDCASVIHPLGPTSTLDEDPAEQFFRVAK